MLHGADLGVFFSDGRCSIRLVRAGEVGVGYPTEIEVQAGPLTGSVLDETVGDYGIFVAGLVSLYQNLSGEAALGSLEGFSLSLVGNGRGGVTVSAKIIDSYTQSFELTFSFMIDQSYLPPIIRALKTEFPVP